MSFPQLSCDSKSKSPFNSNHKSPFTFSSSKITLHMSHFEKWSDDGTVWPFQPSITVDAAIRIDLHSAEVVHLCHNICNNPSGLTGPDLSHSVCGLPTITFHLHTLVQAPLSMSLASQWRQTVSLGTWYGSDVSIISYVPCHIIDDIYMFHAYFMSFLCVFRN